MVVGFAIGKDYGDDKGFERGIEKATRYCKELLLKVIKEAEEKND